MSQSLRQYFYRVKRHWQRHFDSPVLVEWLFALLCEFCRLERSTIKSTNQHEGSAENTNIQTCCLFHKLGSNPTGVDRIRRLFQEMVDSIRTQGNALCWRLCLRFEVALGKIDAARKIFYRGLAKCPWSKALYLDGIRVLRPYLSEEECKELIEFMAAKELHVREDI
uniref:Suppressor of forked domain-containing protein n=1 Tax=Globisporangium ultimum (strain ATCC 200006 / CBS 805.95 / DAOM BR144) TaxID=431595 RepID=K3WGA6_GLOUD